MSYWQVFRNDLRRTGPRFALRVVNDFLSRKLLGRGRRPRQIRVPGFRDPLWYRPRTSDLKVIRQVLLQDDLEPCRALHDVRHVVDCGANIGLAARWFLETFPGVRVAVIEPDPANLALCRLNLTRYADQVTFHPCAVWPTAAPLVIDRGPTGQAEEWAYRVRPARADEPPEVQGLDLATLMDRAGIDAADIVKMDIELAELDVLDHPSATAWLSRTRNLVIELHTPAARAAYTRALAPFTATRQQSGEYDLAFDLRPTGAGAS